MPLFDKTPEIPRQKFKDILKKTDIKVGLGRQLSPIERARIEKRDFPKRLGSSISKSEYERTVRGLERAKSHEQDFTTKIKTGKEIKLLKELEKKGAPQKKPTSLF